MVSLRRFLKREDFVYRTNCLLAWGVYQDLGYYSVILNGNLINERDQSKDSLSDEVLSHVSKRVPLLLDFGGVYEFDSSGVASLISIARGRRKDSVSILDVPGMATSSLEVHRIPEEIVKPYENLDDFLLANKLIKEAVTSNQ